MKYLLMLRVEQIHFMPDTKDVQLPGKVGLKAIGGVMKHLGL